MTAFIALLRAINVGGAGKLPMSELRGLCAEAGFDDVRTYIQSGNVVLKSKLGEAKVKATLEAALTEKMGKPASVIVRTLAELKAAQQRNPFPDAKPAQVIVLFLDKAPPKGALADVVIPAREELELHGRELYVHYPDGQGRSKLKLPFAKEGTGRNLNTIAKLVEMAAS